MSLPTLLRPGMFEFPEGSDLTDEDKSLLKIRPIDAIIAILNKKFELTGIINRVYLFRAFTAAGKSTVFPPEVYEQMLTKSNRGLFMAEPRVTLASNGINDISNFHQSWILGEELAIHTGNQHVMSKRKAYIEFGTTQIIQNYLNRMLVAAGKGNERRLSQLLKRYQIIVIDEAHILEIQTINVIQSIMRLLKLCGDKPLCPMFVFASATLDANAILRYMEITNLKDLKYVVGTVRGVPNYPISENYLPESMIEKLNTTGYGDRVSVKPPQFKSEVKVDKKKFVKLLGGSLDEEYEAPNRIDEVVLEPLLTTSSTLTGGGEITRPVPREEFVAMLGGKPGRLDPFKTIGKIVAKDLVPILSFSRSKVTISDFKREFQCRDVLIFVPGLMMIDNCMMELEYHLKHLNVFKIDRRTEEPALIKWRRANSGKKRFLLIGYSAEYSPLSNKLLDTPYESDLDVLTYETKIIVSTSVIETGKTFRMIYAVVDAGFDTKNIFCPLTFDYRVMRLKKIPENKNQMIQRRGRVGRASPGVYLAMYSEDTLKAMSLNEVPQTVNSGCLSELMYQTQLSHLDKGKRVDLSIYNDYLYPIPPDLLIRTCVDLFWASILGANGEYVPVKVMERWKIYACLAYYVLKMPLYRAIMTASINRYKLPNCYQIYEFNNKTFPMSLESAIRDEYKKAIMFIPEGRRLFLDILEGKTRLIIPYRNDLYDPPKSD